jgi:uncharacterized membrane protein YsdA (DUF1294 family)/cold shock CspA family protein
MAAHTDRVEGTLATWNKDRGFGFITPTTGGRQVFAHIRAFPQGSAPQVGELVSFEVERTPEGKTRARYVRPIGAGAVQRYGAVASSIPSYLPVVAFVVLFTVVSILWHPSFWFAVVYLGTSLICFLIYAVDKSAAIEGGWRVSESALLLLGLFGGWPGAIVAQQALRHKTKKRAFQAAFAGSVVVNVLAFVLLTSPLIVRVEAFIVANWPGSN